MRCCCAGLSIRAESGSCVHRRLSHSRQRARPYTLHHGRLMRLTLVPALPSAHTNKTLEHRTTTLITPFGRESGKHTAVTDPYKSEILWLSYP